jgi:hypothetical protein
MSYSSETSRPNGARPAGEVKENISALKEDATKLAGSVKHMAQNAPPRSSRHWKIKCVRARPRRLGSHLVRAFCSA